MASSTVGIGLTIGAVAQGSVGSMLASTRRSLDGLTKSSRALSLAQIRVARDTRTGLTQQQSNYDRLGRALGRVRTAHDQLTAAAARSNTAIASGQQSWGKLAGTAMAAWGTVKGAIATAGQAASFADTLRDTRIKGRLSAEQESALGDAIRVNVSTTNQSRDDLALGAHQLITGGASFEEAKSQLGLMGQTMTALRTSSEQTTGAMLALRDMGAVDRESMQSGIERLIAIGERGQFTPDMMVNAFAQLGDTIKATGLKGDTAIAELAAGLQVAEGAMGAANAQAGLQSWLSSLNDSKVAVAYERAGVDYATSMAELQQSGMSQYQASLELAGAFIRDSLSTRDQQALLAGDDGRISTMLSELGLGEVFKDANAARFALSIHNNQDAYKQMTGASGEGSLNTLADLRKESPIEQMKALKNTVNDLALDIGQALLPSLLGVVNALAPMVAGIADFVRAHPGVVTAIGSLVAGFVGMRVATVGAMFIFRQLMIPLTQVAKAFHVLRAGIALAQARMALFRSGTVLARGALMTKLARVQALSGALAGRLVTGLRVATKAVWGLGRAMLMSPIGIAVAAIAGAAYLIYKYWEPISGFFKRVGGAVTNVFTGMWARIKDAFDGGIVGVSKLILDWSPLGLFYKAFAGVAGWFGVELPDNFSEFGGKIIGAFTSGIAGMFDGAWQGVTGLFDNAWKGLTNTASGALEGIKRVTDSVWQDVTSVTTSAWNGITGTAESVWGGLTGFFGGVWDGVASVTSRTWGGISADLPSEWTSLRGVAESTWTGIGGFFGGVWEGAKTAFDGGISGVSKQLENFSPLALFRKTFTGVMDWFKSDLPKDFAGSGKALMEGLIGGITNMASSVRESIVGIGESVTGWFRDKLGINSPSRVFMALGANISEGAALGITGSKALVKQAALGMAAATAVSLAAPVLAAPVFAVAPNLAPATAVSTLADIPPAPVSEPHRAVGPERDAGIVIHFSPTINVQGRDGENIEALLEKVLHKASADLTQQFERLMREHKIRAHRRSFDSIGVA